MDITVLSEMVTNAVEGNVEQMGAYIGAGLAMIGAIGAGAGQGYAAGALALAISRNPDARPQIFTAAMIGLGVAESAALYALVVALILIFVAG